MQPVVTDQVACRSVGRSVELVSPAKTAPLIEMSFGLRSLVGPRNHVLDGVPIPPWEGAILMGERGILLPILQSPVQNQLNRLRCCLGCGVG